MKILVLNGSPRKESNTKFLVEAFKDGATKSGHDVTILDVGKMKINGCLACEACHTTLNGRCVQRDDMDEVNKYLHDSDMIVIASPIHYWSFSGQVQSLITRFYAKGKPEHAKAYALIMSSGSPSVYDAPISQYKDILSYFGAKDLGIFKFNGNNQKTEDNYKEMYEFGKSL